MRPSLLAAIPVLVLAAGLAAADEPTARLPVDSESSRQIPALIAQLGSRDYRTREAATRALDTIGEPALTALTAAARSDIPEVADRASKLVFGIRHRLSNDAAIAGRTVALDVRDATVREVLAELEKQTPFW